jgi:hypothetical protein
VQVRDQKQAAEERSQCATGEGETAAASDQGSIASQPPPTKQQQQRQPVLDQSQLWADIAAASYGADGIMDGWDSETEQPKSSESKYLQVSMTQWQASS